MTPSPTPCWTVPRPPRTRPRQPTRRRSTLRYRRRTPASRYRRRGRNFLKAPSRATTSRCCCLASTSLIAKWCRPQQGLGRNTINRLAIKNPPIAGGKKKSHLPLQNRPSKPPLMVHQQAPTVSRPNCRHRQTKKKFRPLPPPLLYQCPPPVIPDLPAKGGCPTATLPAFISSLRSTRQQAPSSYQYLVVDKSIPNC